MTRIVIGLVVALTFASPVRSAEINVYRSWGPGNDKCSKYLDSYANKNLALYYGYLTGVQTGVNADILESRYGDGGSLGTVGDVMAWLASWCRDNPSNIYIEAVEAYLSTILAK